MVPNSAKVKVQRQFFLHIFRNTLHNYGLTPFVSSSYSVIHYIPRRVLQLLTRVSPFSGTRARYNLQGIKKGSVFENAPYPPEIQEINY
jgi:hypothetical protein